jgi:hypothetical protein
MKLLRVLSVGVLSTLLACSAAPEGEHAADVAETVAQPVINGTVSDASQNAVVYLAYYDGRNFGQCSGTLLAPNVVLTARHCVAQTEQAPNCARGSKVRSDHAAEDLYVFLGPNAPDFRSGQVRPAGQGSKLFVPGDELCNADIAVLLLKQPVEGAPIAKIRLSAPPTRRESITAVGFGLTEQGRSARTRMQRTNVPIISVGSSGAGTKEFLVGESICQGDSGGPALSEPGGAVLGVVSRGGNGQAPDRSNPASTCIEAYNIYTQVAPYAPLIMQAFAESGYAPTPEDGTTIPGFSSFGDACDGDDKCASTICATKSDGSQFCSQACAREACPDGYECSEQNGKKICLPPASSEPAVGEPGDDGQNAEPTTTRKIIRKGCSAAPGAAPVGFGGAGALAAVGAAVSLLVTRRRRRAS